MPAVDTLIPEAEATAPAEVQVAGMGSRLLEVFVRRSGRRAAEESAEAAARAAPPPVTPETSARTTRPDAPLDTPDTVSRETPSAETPPETPAGAAGEAPEEPAVLRPSDTAPPVQPGTPGGPVPGTERAADAAENIGRRTQGEPPAVGRDRELAANGRAERARLAGLDDAAVERVRSGGFADFNLDRVENGADLADIIDNTSIELAPEILAATRGTITHQQTAYDASLLNMRPAQLRRVMEATPLRAEQMLEGRNLMITMAERVRAMARLASAPEGTDEDLALMELMIQQFQMVQTHVKGLQTETARTMSSMRITAQSMESVQGLNEIIDEIGGSRNARRRMAAIIGNTDDAAAANAAINASQRATSFQMFMEIWINGLLSGPATHIVNTTTSLANVGVLQIDNMVAGVYGAMWRQITGRDEGVRAVETLAGFTGMSRGLVAGGRNAWDALRTGEPSTLGTRLDPAVRRPAVTAENVRRLPVMRATGAGDVLLREGGAVEAAFDFMGNWMVRGPSRLMMAEDEAVKGLAYYAELNRLAVRQTFDEGLIPGSAFDARVDGLLAEAANPVAGGQGARLHDAATVSAREATFQQQLGDQGRAFQNFIAGTPVLRLIFPFVRTPTNILRWVARRTPGLNLFSPHERDALLGRLGPAEHQLAVGRMMTGSAFFATMVGLSSSGYITGSSPRNRVFRDSLEAVGWQPESFFIPGGEGEPGQYISYRRGDPMSIVVGMAANYSQYGAFMTDEERDTFAAAAIQSVARGMLDNQYLQGLQNLARLGTDIVDGESGSVERFVGRLGGSFVPGTSLQNWVATTFRDQVRRDVRSDQQALGPLDDPVVGEIADATGAPLALVGQSVSIMQEIINRARERSPFGEAGMDLPPIRDFYGEPVIMSPGPMGNLIPAYISVEEFSRERLETAGLPGDPAEWSRLEHGRNMTDEMLDDFLDEVGVAGEFIRLGSPPGPHPRRMAGVDMTALERSDYSRAVNREVIPETRIAISFINDKGDPDSFSLDIRDLNLSQALDELMRSEVYRRGSDNLDRRGSKPRMIRRVVQWYRSEANTDPATGFGGAERIVTEQHPSLLRRITNFRVRTAAPGELIDG